MRKTLKNARSCSRLYCMPNLYYAQVRICSDFYQRSFRISIWMAALSFSVYINVTESKI